MVALLVSPSWQVLVSLRTPVEGPNAVSKMSVYSAEQAVQ